MYPDVVLPSIDFPIKAPVLGPHDRETRMEAFNRCYCLLKYVVYCINTKAVWKAKFSQEAISIVTTIDKSHHH
jgi:hypothetical protein